MSRTMMDSADRAHSGRSTAYHRLLGGKRYVRRTARYVPDEKSARQTWAGSHCSARS